MAALVIGPGPAALAAFEGLMRGARSRIGLVLGEADCPCLVCEYERTMVGLPTLDPWVWSPLREAYE